MPCYAIRETQIKVWKNTILCYSVKDGSWLTVVISPYVEEWQTRCENNVSETQQIWNGHCILTADKVVPTDTLKGHAGCVANWINLVTYLTWVYILLFLNYNTQICTNHCKNFDRISYFYHCCLR